MRLQDLYERHHDRVQFLMIYIREAHPTDGWWLGGPVAGFAIKRFAPQASTAIRDPRSLEERRSAAGQCETALRYGIPTLVDDVDDAVNRAYAAWPTRLYLVDTGGRVAYAGGLGPFGFSPKALGREIAKLSVTGDTHSP